MKALKKVHSDKKGLSKLPTAVRNKMGYMQKGGKVVNPDDKVRPEVGRWYMKQSKEIKSLFDNAYDSAYKKGASGAQARESAIKAIEKKIGKTIEFKGGGKVYKTGGKAPVDPPTTSPESKSSYNIGNMSFKGEEADRLIAFNEHLDKDFSNLDLFQKTEQIEKFINSKGHKSSESMKAYNVDPALKKTKAPSIEDTFESSFGESSFGGSDPFDDDPDIQRMREEAAARNKKKGRGKKFNTGGAVVKKYKKGGKVFKPHNMYKNGKAVMAKTMKDHLRLKKQGYSHKKA